MLLIDTSVWVSVFRDRSSQVRQQLETLIADREILLTGYEYPAPDKYTACVKVVDTFGCDTSITVEIEVSHYASQRSLSQCGEVSLD